MSKSTKIVVSLLVIAGFVCLAIGTIFACDYISQSNNSVALYKKQVIVASAERFALPNVRIDEPLLDIEVPVDGFAPGVYRFDLSVYVPWVYSFQNDGFQLSQYSSPNSLYLFTVVSTNIPSFTSGDVCVLDIFFETPEDNDEYGVFNIATPDYEVSEFITLDGLGDYFVEVEALDRFVVSNRRGELQQSIPVPSDFFVLVISPGVLIVEELLGILVSGLTGIGQGLGESLSPIATAIFVNTAGDGLSVFGILIAVFAAISLGLTFTRFVLNFVTSWGNRNR